MFRTRIKSLITLPAMAGVLLLTACQASGGGTIASTGSCATGPGGQTTPATATFGFAATTNTDPQATSLVTFQGNFTDRCAAAPNGPVNMRLNGRLTPTPPPPFVPPVFGLCVQGDASYVPVGAPNQEGGIATITACDQMLATSDDPTASLSDFVTIDVLTGPYAGYSNGGVLVNTQTGTGIGKGNIVVRLP
jgi:hypothetical protein